MVAVVSLMWIPCWGKGEATLEEVCVSAGQMRCEGSRREDTRLKCCSIIGGDNVHMLQPLVFRYQRYLMIIATRRSCLLKVRVSTHLKFYQKKNFAFPSAVSFIPQSYIKLNIEELPHQQYFWLPLLSVGIQQQILAFRITLWLILTYFSVSAWMISACFPFLGPTRWEQALTSAACRG